MVNNTKEISKYFAQIVRLSYCYINHTDSLLKPIDEKIPEKKYTYDEAIEKTGIKIFFFNIPIYFIFLILYYFYLLQFIGNGTFQKRIFALFGASIMIVLIEGLNMSFVLPAAKCDLKITNAEQGFINSIGYIGIVVSSHFWGFLADTWGRKKVLQLSFFLTFLFAALSSLSYSSLMLLVTRFIVGLRCKILIYYYLL